MFKINIKLFLLIAIFSTQLSFHPLFGMNDEFVVDFKLGKNPSKTVPLKTLREIPNEAFRKSCIKLKNIPSNETFFDNKKDKKTGKTNENLSIAHKILKSILDGYIKKIEYSYFENKKTDLLHVDNFMISVAYGKDIVEINDENGKLFIVESPFYSINTKYTIKKLKIPHRIILIDNGNTHFATQEWQEKQRLEDLAMEKKEEERNRRIAERKQEFIESNGPTFGMNDDYFDEEEE